MELRMEFEQKPIRPEEDMRQGKADTSTASESMKNALQDKNRESIESKTFSTGGSKIAQQVSLAQQVENDLRFQLNELKVPPEFHNQIVASVVSKIIDESLYSNPDKLADKINEGFKETIELEKSKKEGNLIVVNILQEEQKRFESKKFNQKEQDENEEEKEEKKEEEREPFQIYLAKFLCEQYRNNYESILRTELTSNEKYFSPDYLDKVAYYNIGIRGTNISQSS